MTIILSPFLSTCLSGTSPIFLILIGKYKSVNIASVDSELRKYIYNTVKESKLLELLSHSDMERELNRVFNNVSQFIDKDPKKNNDLQLMRYELRNYINDVINELHAEESKY